MWTIPSGKKIQGVGKKTAYGMRKSSKNKGDSYKSICNQLKIQYMRIMYAISMQTIKLLEIRFTVESLAKKSVIIWLLLLFEAIRLLFCEHKFKHKWILKRNMWCTRSSFGWPNGQTNRLAKLFFSLSYQISIQPNYWSAAHQALASALSVYTCRLFFVHSHSHILCLPILGLSNNIGNIILANMLLPTFI